MALFGTFIFGLLLGGGSLLWSFRMTMKSDVQARAFIRGLLQDPRPQQFAREYFAERENLPADRVLAADKIAAACDGFMASLKAAQIEALSSLLTSDQLDFLFVLMSRGGSDVPIAVPPCSPPEKA